MPKASRIRHSVHHPSIKVGKEGDNAPVDVLMKSDVFAVTEDVALKETMSEPVVLTKKVKQKERREAFIQKLEPSTRHFSKSHERRLKRKAKEQLAGNMHDLQTALASLDHEGAPQTVEKPSPSISGEVKPKVSSGIGKIGKGNSSTLSKAQRKRLLELERLRHPLILANPDFTSNPFQTIRTHAQNTLITHELPS